MVTNKTLMRLAQRRLVEFALFQIFLTRSREIIVPTPKAKPDKELLLNLYCIACTVNAIMFENEPLYNNPYYEKEDLLPFIREVNTEFRKNSNRESSNRTRIFKIVANKFRQDKNIPKPKNSNQRG